MRKMLENLYENVFMCAWSLYNAVCLTLITSCSKKLIDLLTKLLTLYLVWFIV